MARYVLIANVAGAPTPGAYTLYVRGTTFADCAANAVGDDIIWPALAHDPCWRSMAPLDADAAKTMRGVEIAAPGSLPKAAFRDGITGPATEWECLTQAQRNRWFESEEKRKALK